MNEFLVRQEVFRARFGFMINGKSNYKFNLEKLKQDLKFEDAFYEIVLETVADHYGFNIRFQDGDVCFIKKNKK